MKTCCLSFLFCGVHAFLLACTGIQLKAKDGSFVNGRTVEFGTTIELTALFVPRGLSFEGETSQGKGLSYTSQYASIGMMAYDTLSIIDGINEKGLSVGVFYFPTFAEYTPLTPENREHALSPLNFPNWVLANFASVEEVKNGLSAIVITPLSLPEWGGVPPFHYIVYDRTGKSIVIEPRKGKLEVFDNSLGSITNSPGFDWHLTNLRNYINLRVGNVAPIEIDGLTLSPVSQGSGMVGLPGDFTSPSRFIRATIFSYTSIPQTNSDQAVLEAFHVLNQFDIPLGVVRGNATGKMVPEYTQMTTVKDPNTIRYYYKTYDDQSLRMIDLLSLDMDEKAAKKLPTTGSQNIQNISDKLAP